MGAHMAALILYALDDPKQAGAVGWFIAYAIKDGPSLSLAALKKGHDSLPDGPWKNDADPRALMVTVPVFGIEQFGTLLTEPQELVGIDWSGVASFTIFKPMAGHVPFMVERAAAYWDVIQDWYAHDMPEPGIEKTCRMYGLLYNAGLYLEAYKMLEMRWMAEHGAKKEFLHGLMQLAIGLHQISTGKFALQQLEEAYGRITTNKAVFPAPTIDRFIKRLAKATRLIKSYGPEKYQEFDLRMFPKMWFESPWKQLLRFKKG